MEQGHENKLTPVFYANKKAYESKLYRKIWNVGGSRSSKTVSICQLLALTASQEKKSITITSQSLPHLKRGARRDFLQVLHNYGIYRDADFNMTDNIYHFPSGSYVEFVGADEPGKMHGSSRDLLFINEANLINFDTFIQMAIRCNETIFADLNPFDEYSYVFKEIKKSDSKLIRSTYLNNKGNFNDWMIRELESLREADQNLWNIYGLGVCGVSSDNVYTQYNIIDTFPPCEIEAYAIDWGGDHPMAVVKAGIKENKLYAEELLYESHLTIEDLCDKLINEFGFTYSHKIVADSAEPRSIDALLRRGLNVVPADKSVYAGIMAVKSKVLNITRNSTNLLKEIKSYKFKLDKDGKPTNYEVVKFKDDCLDCLRYICLTLFSKKEKKLIWATTNNDVDYYGFPHSSSVNINWS